MTGQAATHWDAAYQRGESNLSWYQPTPAVSLRMIADAQLGPAAAVIDVGGGASRLVDALLDRGHLDVSVLDVSPAGLDLARHRLGPRAEDVRWVIDDVLVWQPGRRYDLWHDRAVFHFQTSAADRRSYVATMNRATRLGSIAIIGAFAAQGPQRCSGLPVARYGAQDIAAELGARWRLLDSTSEEHTTPHGVSQPFTWTVFSKQAVRL